MSNSLYITSNKNQVQSDYIKAELHLPTQVKGIIIFSVDDQNEYSALPLLIQSLIQDHQFGVATFQTPIHNRDHHMDSNSTQDIPVYRIVSLIRWIKKSSPYSNLGLSIWGIGNGVNTAIKVANLLNEHLINAIVLQGSLSGFAGQLTYQLAFPSLLLTNRVDPYVIPIQKCIYKVDQYYYKKGYQSKEQLNHLMNHACNWLDDVFHKTSHFPEA